MSLECFYLVIQVGSTDLNDIFVLYTQIILVTVRS